MRAIEYDEYGTAGVLHLSEDVAEPHPGPGRIRIRVAGAGVNPADWKIRQGLMARRPLAAPRILGLDAAGVVDELGDGVEGVEPGDRVFGQGDATTAEFAVLRVWGRVPDEVDLVSAAGLPLAVETAHRVLRLLALSPGDVLVIDGAAGGVGTAAVQLAVARGLTVVGTASESNHDLLRDLGAIPTTYGDGLPERVRALVPGPVAGAVDMAGKGSIPELIELTGDPSAVVTIADFSAGESGVHVTGASDDAATVGAFEEVGALIHAGRYRIVIDEILPWTDAVEAHTRSETGHVRGKLVLRVV